MIPTVSIVIPTQRRPAALARAVSSALAQTGIAPERIELVVVDNDALPTAAELVQGLSAEASFPVRYVHEPKSGVANARNAGVAAARGAFLAFLDDDEEAPPGWIAALVKAQAEWDADVVFGPVRARAPNDVLRHRHYLERFYSREGPAGACLIDGFYGCGDSLVRRDALPHPAEPFSAHRNQIGGEDDLLFAVMQERGARFAWAPEAWVWEDPAPERLTLGYALRRAFAYGQGATQHCASAQPSDRTGVAGWMLAGLAQAIVFGLAAAPLWLAGAPQRAEMLDRAARGLGKVLWWGPFKMKFYGLTIEVCCSHA